MGDRWDYRLQVYLLLHINPNQTEVFCSSNTQNLNKNGSEVPNPVVTEQNLDV